jgi:hypothetical protein
VEVLLSLVVAPRYCYIIYCYLKQRVVAIPASERQLKDKSCEICYLHRELSELSVSVAYLAAETENSTHFDYLASVFVF